MIRFYWFSVFNLLCIVCITNSLKKYADIHTVKVSYCIADDLEYPEIFDGISRAISIHPDLKSNFDGNVIFIILRMIQSFLGIFFLKERVWVNPITQNEIKFEYDHSLTEECFFLYEDDFTLYENFKDTIDYNNDGVVNSIDYYYYLDIDVDNENPNTYELEIPVKGLGHKEMIELPRAVGIHFLDLLNDWLENFETEESTQLYCLSRLSWSISEILRYVSCWVVNFFRSWYKKSYEEIRRSPERIDEFYVLLDNETETWGVNPTFVAEMRRTTPNVIEKYKYMDMGIGYMEFIQHFMSEKDPNWSSSLTDLNEHMKKLTSSSLKKYSGHNDIFEFGVRVFEPEIRKNLEKLNNIQIRDVENYLYKEKERVRKGRSAGIHDPNYVDNCIKQMKNESNGVCLVGAQGNEDNLLDVQDNCRWGGHSPQDVNNFCIDIVNGVPSLWNRVIEFIQWTFCTDYPHPRDPTKCRHCLWKDGIYDLENNCIYAMLVCVDQTLFEWLFPGFDPNNPQCGAYGTFKTYFLGLIHLLSSWLTIGLVSVEANLFPCLIWNSFFFFFPLFHHS